MDDAVTVSRFDRLIIVLAMVFGLIALASLVMQGAGSSHLYLAVATVVLAAFSSWLWLQKSRVGVACTLLFASMFAAFLLLGYLNTVSGDASRSAGAPMGHAGYWNLVISAWLLAWASVSRFAEIDTLSRVFQILLAVLIPLVFGVWLLLLWEFFTKGFGVPQVLLPAPSDIGDRFSNSLPILWADFKQTFLKSVLTGYIMGCVAGFFIAILIDRSPFLKRGLLPVGNLVAALPIVGIAPIMVMWFGFDWQSKAAVVVVMTFFPMLVNTVSGLAAASRIQHDLMNTYAASYWQSLIKLRLPEAMPFIFNALKINSTLALIGAIVAEFFGTPIVGMGFRISTEVGKMNVDMVWAEIAVAALAGSIFYGVVALIERLVTFWHPSIRATRST